MPRPAKPEVEEWRPDLSPDEPVTIVGAGLAGLACAIVLARAGRPVIVREWHTTVGNRFHGDFQGLKNWSDGLDVLDELRAPPWCTFSPQGGAADALCVNFTHRVTSPW